ncbi:DUF4442 domain-containing protein [Maribacter sp. 2307ULW6-5]|uniref:DUF4442 domain-containing protein n=1 Tax=Maribacter sp. 2307ULW6-5 TaxID=3386275 RepID=UPI0039BD6E04
MSFYQRLAKVGEKYLPKSTLFKYGFNLSPMYRRSTGKLTSVSKDLSHITVALRLSYKNRNFVGTMFGGSMFAAVDPIPMVQLMQLLGDEYVVWDKSAEIFFKRPGTETMYAAFHFSAQELETIKTRVASAQEIDFVKKTTLTNKDGSVVFCEVHKTIYVAQKGFYKAKRAAART